MATAHGAGLMLLPVLLSIPAPSAMPPVAHGVLGVLRAAAVVVLHTSAMFVVMGTMAVAVYQWLGLKLLRSAWINLDAIWAAALMGAGVLSLVV
jgi:hypothetical protein